tara:strand:+ start:4576 stop:4860 length:285 start_codon:yes stop_codon:yes gene_type:complete
MNYKLYENDYVIFDIENGEFDFIINDYPYIYARLSVKETIQDLCYECDENGYGYDGECYDNEIENIVFVPTTELPEEIQNKLLKMIIDVKESNK